MTIRKILNTRKNVPKNRFLKIVNPKKSLIKDYLNQKKIEFKKTFKYLKKFWSRKLLVQKKCDPKKCLV